LAKMTNRIPSLLARKEMHDNKRYTQRDIARDTNLTESLISRTMRSKTLDSLSLADAYMLAEWLGCSIYELFELADD
jgi:transcriptional regulator with XRE-family HTH domain